MPSQTFNYTGSQQTFTVPDGLSRVTVKCWGAGGGSGGSGAGRSAGGYAKATIPTTPGETLYLYVGGQGGDGRRVENDTSHKGGGGWNGGANGGEGWSPDGIPGYSGGGGGGASDVRRGGTTHNDRVVVAGGGGGSGGESFGRGGDGGGVNGEDGHHNEADAPDGGGGTQSAGGAAGDDGNPGSFGSGGTGGTGVVKWNNVNGDGAGGGGGGWYGGGGGTGEENGASSGGGGSGYVSGSSTQLSTAGGNTSHGAITLEWESPPAAPTNVQVDATRETEIDLAWDAVSDADGYDVYRAESTGTTLSDYTQVGSSTTTTFTDTALLHGTTYYYRITATKMYTAPSDPSTEINGTTTVPDVTGLAFDASVEDELTVSWDAVLNTGQYRIEYRITGSGNAFALAGEQPHTDTEITIGGLRDGERYDIRIRGQT